MKIPSSKNVLDKGYTLEHKLVELVCKKLRKEKSAEVIAEELEEETEKIQSICEAAIAYAPEFECDNVYQAWKTK